MSVPCGREPLAIRMFGSIAVAHGQRNLGPRDFGGARPKQVLEILLAARGRSVTVDRLAEVLWGEDLPDDAAGAIQTFVSVLRRHLCSDADCARELIVTERGAYRFAVKRAQVDLDRFDELLARAGRAPSHIARRCLAQALALATDEVLEDEPYTDWAQELRATYRGRVIGAHLEAADAALAVRDYRAGLGHAQAATKLDPLCERAHRISMLALYAMGQGHDALAGYRRLRSLLVKELGLEPNVETRSLEAAILREEDVSSLLPRSAREVKLRTRQPWLRFLGRRAEIVALGQVLDAALAGQFALVLIDGEAGLGKSRLLEEFAATVGDVRVGRAVCSPLAQHLERVPLAAALRDALGESDFDLPQLPALRPVLPELGLGRPPLEFSEIEILEAIAEVIRRHEPLVLIFDDIHRADPGTIAALEYMRLRCAAHPVMVVGALRGEDTPPEHPVRRLATTETIVLEPSCRLRAARQVPPEARSSCRNPCRLWS